ncbi:hypothetical protein ARSEF1564_010190 [Beauveria bassiana]
MLDKMDTHFGPADVGRFDFTILFEHTMLGLVPTGIIVLALPSALLSIFLPITMLFDITMARSYFMRGGLAAIAALKAVIATLKLALAILEEMPKRNLLYSDKIRDNAGTEGFSGFWNRSMLIWVTRLVVKGSHQHLKVEDLPPIGQQDNPEQLYNRFTPFWDTLAAATISKWPLIRAGMQGARTVWNEKIQSRVVSTSNFLAQLKNIKAMGLNTAISKFLQEKPLSEIGTSMSERNARIFIFAIYAFGNTMAPVAVFAGARFWTRAADPMAVPEILATYAIVLIVSLLMSELFHTVDSKSHNPRQVIGAFPFIESLYDDVIEACDLTKDLDDLTDGDQTMTGSNGCNLSGGQKQRIGLARALFSRYSIIILDDLLCSLDETTATKIIQRLLGPKGPLRS